MTSIDQVMGFVEGLHAGTTTRDQTTAVSLTKDSPAHAHQVATRATYKSDQDSTSPIVSFRYFYSQTMGPLFVADPLAHCTQQNGDQR